MSRIKSKNTSLELKVRKYLYGRGFRYRLHYQIEGKPDIVFIKKKIAVFVNGCFWHMHGCSLSRIPNTRKEFWSKKLKRNRERDLEVTNKLISLGWEVTTLWECELKDDLENALSDLAKSIS